MVEEKELLLEDAIREGWLPKEMQLTKVYKNKLKIIAKNLPSRQVIEELRIVDGKETYVEVNRSINQYKRLVKEWENYGSAYGVLIYGLSIMLKDYHNEWTMIINEIFGVDYPLPCKSND